VAVQETDLLRDAADALKHAVLGRQNSAIRYVMPIEKPAGHRADGSTFVGSRHRFYHGAS
jgi:hypothetical protein